MIHSNPLARHAGRAGRRTAGWGTALATLGGVAAVTFSLRGVWTDRWFYSGVAIGVRELAIVGMAAAVVLGLWSSVRAADLGRRMETPLEEYRHTLLSPTRIVVGLLAGALGIPLLTSVLLGLVAVGVSYGANSGEGQGVWTALGQGLQVAVLGCSLCVLSGSVGLSVARRSGSTASAACLVVTLLILSWSPLWLLEFAYTRIESPGAAVTAALVVNPVLAVGSSLGADVLRYGWIYERFHAAEYAYVYPPGGWTAAFLFLAAMGPLWFVRRSLR